MADTVINQEAVRLQGGGRVLPVRDSAFGLCGCGQRHAPGHRRHAVEIADRLSRTFTRDESGRRPVYGGTEKFQSDPNWRDHLLFYEFFHGDNGAGLGASHQTGWTGLVAKFIQLYGFLDPKRALEVGKGSAFQPGTPGTQKV